MKVKSALLREHPKRGLRLEEPGMVATEQGIRLADGTVILWASVLEYLPAPEPKQVTSVEKPKPARQASSRGARKASRPRQKD